MSPQDKINLHHNAGAVATQSIKEIVLESIRQGKLSHSTFEELSKDMVKAIKVLRKEIAVEPEQPKIIS